MQRRAFTGLAATALVLPSLASAQAREEMLELRLKDGTVTIRFLTDVAPRHVARIKDLVKRGFYDGTPFHRVIDGFMAQGGDPTGTGTGGARSIGMADIPAEFTRQYSFTRGMCGMARSSDPNSANSQFFIMLAANPGLDGQYTIWGRVIAGMDAVDRIKRGDQARNGVVSNPDKLLSARLVNA